MTTIRKILPLILFTIGLSGCTTLQYSEPDKYGFVWFTDHKPCKQVEIKRVHYWDIRLNCGPYRFACTIDRKGYCTVIVPIEGSDDLLEHEMRHTRGENHLANKVEHFPWKKGD